MLAYTDVVAEKRIGGRRGMSTYIALSMSGSALDERFINDFGDHILSFTDPAENRAQIVGRIAPLE
jgi:hypothetical protein